MPKWEGESRMEYGVVARVDREGGDCCTLQ